MLDATGYNRDDLKVLTEFWQRETRHINDNIDETLKSAQDHAYAVGYRRAREDLKAIRAQRDELFFALEGMVSIARLTIGWSVTPPNADGPLAVAEELIARLKA